MLALSVAALALPSAAAPLDFTPPHVDSSSFVQSVTEYANAFGIDEVRAGPALSNLEMEVNHWLVPDPESLNKGRLDGFQFDMFFNTPYPDMLKWIVSPRPSVGGIINLGG